MKIVKYLEIFGLLIKGASETIQNEAKYQKVVFLRMLLSALGASLFGNMLADKGVLIAAEGTIRASENF